MGDPCMTRLEAHLVALHRGREHSTAKLGDLFGVGRSTVYRANRPRNPTPRARASRRLRQCHASLAGSSIRGTWDGVGDALKLTAVFTPDEDGWMAAG